MHTHKQHSFGKTREGTQWSNPIGFLTGTLTDERVRTHANDRHFFGQMPNEETLLHSQQDCWHSKSCEAPHIPSRSQTERVRTDDKSTHTLTRLSGGQIIPRVIICDLNHSFHLSGISQEVAPQRRSSQEVAPQRMSIPEVAPQRNEFFNKL